MFASGQSIQASCDSAGFQSPPFEALLDDMLGSILNARAHHRPSEDVATGPVMIEILEWLKEQGRHKRWLKNV